MQYQYLKFSLTSYDPVYFPLVPVLLVWLCMIILILSIGVTAIELNTPADPPAIMYWIGDKSCGFDLPLNSFILIWMLLYYNITITYYFPILLPANWSDVLNVMPVNGDKVPKLKIVLNLYQNTSFWIECKSFREMR